jgi:hypothetical protein
MKKKLMVVVDNTAPWATNTIKKIRATEGRREEVERLIGSLKHEVDEIDFQLEAADWLQSWLAVRKIGIATELGEVLGTNKFAAACKSLGIGVEDGDYKRSRVYKLMRKFNQLILAKIPITLWETHIAALEKFFDDIENAKEAQFWSGTPFTVVPYETWAMGILFNTNDVEMEDLSQEMTQLGKNRQ